jgi:hypothetical protein
MAASLPQSLFSDFLFFRTPKSGSSKHGTADYEISKGLRGGIAAVGKLWGFG